MLERLWRATYLRVKGDSRWLVIGITVLVVAVAVPVTVLMLYLATLYGIDLSRAEAVRVLLIALACETAAVVVGLLLVRHPVSAILAWAAQSNDRPSPEEAWTLMVRAPIWFVPRPFIVLSLLHLAITDVYIATVADMSLTGYLGIAVATQVSVAFVWMLTGFWVEFILRPAIEEIDAQLPIGAERPAKAWRLSTRIVLPIPVVGAVGGMVTGAFVVQFSDNIDVLLLVASLGAVLCGTFLAFLVKGAISDQLVRPIADLSAGAERVGSGDFTEKVPVVGGDELGALASSFNEMQLGLRELAELRVEREQLLDEVLASRARIVSASDAERRRVERNLHDGAQQRLVALALQLSMLEDGAPDDATKDMAGAAKAELAHALEELRELARGLHPQLLSTGGLEPALRQLAERSTIPVTVTAPSERFPDAVESTAYFVVSEALANVAKYAEAASASVSAQRLNGKLVVRVSDDGVGGADPGSGSGLAGLADRVAALAGRLEIESPAGGGTKVSVELPVAMPESGT